MVRRALVGLWVTSALLAPGPSQAASDSTDASQVVAAAPTRYTAISDRNAYAKPALPALGGAGYQFADPTFGSRMLRVTDGRTRPGSVNLSFRVPSNAHLSAWNTTSSAFYVVSNDGTVIPYAFDPIKMTASRIQPAGTGDGGLTLGFYVEPQFSLVDPNIIYGAVNGGNNRTIAQYNFLLRTYSTLLDLDTIVGGLSGTYIGGMMSGGTPAENLMAFFGGPSQDSHYYALWVPVANMGARKLLNTMDSTINGAPTGATLNFHLHSAQIDRSGRFVFLYPTSVDLSYPRYASQVYVWDTTSDTITAITSGGADGGPAMRPYGHDASGYGKWVNQDCCTSSSWDAGQWQFRDLTALQQTNDLIAPVQAAKEVYLADHTTWNNAQPATLVPVISSTYRFGSDAAPWRAWDDEIIGIETANRGGGTVWRFAHHRSDVRSDSDPATPYFWYEPIANVSPDGRWILFTSNWEKTLGTDAADGTARQDVFIVRLTPAHSSDFDGDGLGDPTIWRPSSGTWFTLTSSSGFNDASALTHQWGVPGAGDVPFVGDIDGDGLADLVLWRASTGTWYWLLSSKGYAPSAAGVKQWGNQALGDQPMLADIDGDGRMDLVVWRASTSTWYWLTSSSGYDYAAAGSRQWGSSGAGDIPKLADIDGDGRADLIVWRPSTGMWYWLTSSSGYSYAAAGTKAWGMQGDIPMVADMNGDGKADLVVWRPKTGAWFWTSTAAASSTYSTIQWGVQALGDVPLLTDLDGDGKADLVVWRPSSGTWYWITSSTGYSYSAAGSKQWGAAGDKPVVP